MTDGGDRTIEAYERASDRYLAAHHAASGEVLAWLERFVAMLPPRPSVLEIGSGPGTDADLLEERGVRVQRSDATRAFADRLREHGHAVLDLDVRRDPIPSGFDGVLADAVLLHLDRTEFAAALTGIRGALGSGGALAFTMKEGDGEEWHSRRLNLPRRFVYWRADQLRAAVESAGFEVVGLHRSHGEQDDWLQVLARSR